MKKKYKNIFVFGLGLSGESVIKFFLKKNSNIFVWDSNKKKRQKITKKFPKTKLMKIKNYEWKTIDIIIVSPGISFKHPYLKIPIKLKIPLYRDLEIFSQNVNKNKVIAITGTNGKSTAVSLLNHLIRDNQSKIFVGGNIAPPLLNGIGKIKFQKYIIELSSFQLESAPTFNSKISILLNIFEDHTDRYKTIREYAQAKKNIFNIKSKNQYRIIGIDDEYSLKIYRNLKNNKTIPISTNKKIINGISLINKTIIDNYFKKKSLNLDGIKLKVDFEQNKQNILLSYTIFNILNLKITNFLKKIKTFEGLQHRSEIIYDRNNLKIINNSKATNLSSTIHSIKSYNNIHLIMGGRLKHKNFKEIFNYKKRINKIYLIGESTDYLKKYLSKEIKCEKCFKISNALKKCFINIKNNKKYSTILLAPACSSFDQYSNFQERGKDFKIHSMKLLKRISL